MKENHFSSFHNIRVQSWVKSRVLHLVKKKGGLGLFNLKPYFAVYCLVWLTKWVLLRNRRLLSLEGHNLRFSKVKLMWTLKIIIIINKWLSSVEIIRCTILRIWNRYKPRLCLKHLSGSLHKNHFIDEK